MAVKKQTVEYIEISDIVPTDWATWFYCAISDNAPFSWGDNNRTLITAERFHDHCVDALQDQELYESNVNVVDIDQFLGMLEGLGQTYIDLEN